MWLADAESPAAADAESPAPAPKSFATETARTAWTNVFATPFVPSRPQPPAQGSNGVDKSGNSAATTSQALTPGLAKDEGSKLSDKAAVFHPAAKSPTQHSSSASPRIAAARVRSSVNMSTCWAS